MIRCWIGLVVGLLFVTVPPGVLAQEKDKQDEKEKQEDEAYLAKFPGFKATPYEGRKNKSNRAVFMELFTGATCPPCVAADLAFDVVMKAYERSEVVLVQYHLHIPGSDPMTNPGTLARWRYYEKAYPKEATGIPTSVFNGKILTDDGGPAKAAKKHFDDYRRIMDPLLEVPEAVQLAVQTQRKGDQIDIQVDMSGLKQPGAEKKLRILLAEETVRYVGSNKVRFHHNVVRAFAGGVDGLELKEPASKHKFGMNVSDLRADLSKYLDGTKRKFAARPLDLKNLRVIAFVQDDNTKEILQAVHVEVAEK